MAIIPNQTTIDYIETFVKYKTEDGKEIEVRIGLSREDGEWSNIDSKGLSSGECVPVEDVDEKYSEEVGRYFENTKFTIHSAGYLLVLVEVK